MRKSEREKARERERERGSCGPESLCVSLLSTSHFASATPECGSGLLLCTQTMQLRKNTAVVVFLVLQWNALGRTDGEVHHLSCVSSETTVTCSLAEADLQGSQKMQLEVVAEQTVEIRSLGNSSGGFSPCSWAQRETANMLPIQRFTRDMDGLYTVVCGNSNYSVNISVHVTAPKKRPSIPQLTVSEGEGHTVSFRCASAGNPKPKITWYTNYKPSSQHLKEEGNQDMEMAVSTLDGFNYQTSNTNCCATNSQGKECTLIYHYDLGKPMQKTEAPQILLNPGQSLALRCKNKKTPVKWFFNNTELSGVKALWYSSVFEYFSIESVSEHNSGEYVCKSEDGQSKATQVQVHEEGLIEILELNENVRIWEKEKATFCLQVQVLAYPKPQCDWITPNGTKVQSDETHDLWNNHTFKLCNPEPGQYLIQLRTDKKLVTKNLSLCVTDTPKFNVAQNLHEVTCMTRSSLPWAVSWRMCPLDANCTDSTMWKETSGNLQEFSDSGHFCQKKILFFKAYSEINNHIVHCCFTNLDGSYCSEPITVKKPPSDSSDSMVLIVMCSMLVFALLLVSLTLVHFIRKKKTGYESQLQMIQIVGPSDNDYIYIDFRDFKYDQKWEFPRENLELGKVLGSGAFGMVVQATAYGISKPGVSMQVAVKMLKDKHQAVEKEALMSELKMLTHLGHHTNIVNLLGACTGTGPIYLIFQYCCHGDLLNYLKNRRENFYKSLADAFNKDRFSGLYQNYQRKRNSSEFTQSDDISYMHMSPVTKEREALLSTSTDVTDEIFESEDEDLQTLTYDDLLCFSYQVAKGMEFLSSKNCIHRDLAARNILVTQGRLVKIGDFGLSRDIENDSNYVVRGNARLPVKWMAPESIFKGMYTMQSDVWAYGILLWEIFSLGVTPYPGIKVDNNFYVMIERGFQMERPYYASESVYNVMCRCWALESRDRPCFSKLVAFMEYQLTDVEEQLYYNVGGQKNNDSIYKNAPVILQRAETVEEEVVCQSALTDSSCKTETVEEDPDTKAETVETETCI
ncbi:hypothetical protein MHYP_G00292240 [Metynnis hypsauchen]